MKALLLAFSLSACASPPRLTDFHELHPAAVLDIRYATPNNFTHQAVYPAARCLLREPVARKLALAAAEFEAMGLKLKVYDCYRPLSVQRRFWELVPDERYVANPKKGSRHNRGAAVDVGLVDASGKDLEFPSGYDDFTEKAHRDFAGASPEAAKNRKLLEDVMGRHGFVGLSTEWWHFDSQGWQAYPLLDVPISRTSGPG